MIKKRFWVGVAAALVLLLTLPTFAMASSITRSNESYTDRSEEGQARWSLMDDRTQAEMLAFTSTFSVNTAASLRQSSGNSLSFASFGRVPFYQLLMIRNEATSNSLTAASAPVTSLPEPTTLLLLGSGLATLAVGLRRKSKN